MPTKSEKSKDYKFFFNSIKKAVKQCYEVDYRPTALIADAASAITNGFSEAFLYEVDALFVSSMLNEESINT